MLLTVLLFACSGCFSEVSIRRVSPQERMDYGSLFSGEGISDETGNLLGNYLLDEVYEEDPEEAIRRLEVIFRNEPRSEYLAALADVSLNGGIRFRRDPAQDLSADKGVIDDHIRTFDQLRGLHREQARIARPGPGQPDFPGRSCIFF